jgi:hypothetical protein
LLFRFTNSQGKLVIAFPMSNQTARTLFYPQAILWFGLLMGFAPISMGQSKSTPSAEPAALSVPEPGNAPEKKNPEEDEKNEILRYFYNVLIAKGPARLFEAKVDPKYLDPSRADYGKGARPGEAFAEVSPGFVAMAARNRDSVGGLVKLPSPIGTHAYAYVYISDFADVGSESWRKWWDAMFVDFSVVPEMNIRKLEPAAVSPQSELLDVFSPQNVLISNREGSFEKSWKLVVTNRRNDVLAIGPPLGLARTTSGWFFGFLSQGPPPSLAKIKWPDLVKNRSHPCRLELETSMEAKRGVQILKISDFTKARRRSSIQTDPLHSRIHESEFPILLEFGLAGVLADFSLPASTSVRRLASVVENGPEKQTVVKEVLVRFAGWSKERTLVEVISTVDEREIERSVSAKGEAVVKPKQWKTLKRTADQWIDNDGDGGVRLTDGNKIYDLSPSGAFGRLELRIFRAVTSTLGR